LCFRWYALWRWSKYNIGSPAKPANPLSAKPLGGIDHEVDIMMQYSTFYVPPDQIDYSKWISLILAVISICVSIITLYIAHIRGPQIKLNYEGKTAKIIESRRSPDLITLTIRLIISNIGTRTGILYNFSLIPKHKSNPRIEISPPTDTELPKPIQPGEYYEPKIIIEFPKEPLRKSIETNHTLVIEAKYSSSGSFQKYVNNSDTIEVDLKNYIGLAQQ